MIFKSTVLAVIAFFGSLAIAQAQAQQDMGIGSWRRCKSLQPHGAVQNFCLAVGRLSASDTRLETD
jgi:hypothetical protein